MGAVGGMIVAFSRGKLDMALLKHGLESTARLSCFVMFILIGSTIFSFTFTAVDGPDLGRAPVRQAARRRDRLPGVRGTR